MPKTSIERVFSLKGSESPPFTLIPNSAIIFPCCVMTKTFWKKTIL